ncbi:MAG: hypothetical protein DME08_03850 [Candidatus Rokuibacteriota bacterium]|nr:MAG: hypothetical protein DME08_03850 [Candidatus Rokubacteria bacterium]
MPSFLVRNWHLKLLSLAVAAGLWLFVAVGERSQLALRVRRYASASTSPICPKEKASSRWPRRTSRRRPGCG